MANNGGHSRARRYARFWDEVQRYLRHHLPQTGSTLARDLSKYRSLSHFSFAHMESLMDRHPNAPNLSLQGLIDGLGLSDPLYSKIDAEDARPTSIGPTLLLHAATSDISFPAGLPEENMTRATMDAYRRGWIASGPGSATARLNANWERRWLQDEGSMEWEAYAHWLRDDKNGMFVDLGLDSIPRPYTDQLRARIYKAELGFAHPVSCMVPIAAYDRAVEGIVYFLSLLADDNCHWRLETTTLMDMLQSIRVMLCMRPRRRSLTTDPCSLRLITLMWRVGLMYRMEGGLVNMNLVLDQLEIVRDPALAVIIEHLESTPWADTPIGQGDHTFVTRKTVAENLRHIAATFMIENACNGMNTAWPGFRLVGEFTESIAKETRLPWTGMPKDVMLPWTTQEDSCGAVQFVELDLLELNALKDLSPEMQLLVLHQMHQHYVCEHGGRQHQRDLYQLSFLMPKLELNPFRYKLQNPLWVRAKIACLLGLPDRSLYQWCSYLLIGAGERRLTASLVPAGLDWLLSECCKEWSWIDSTIEFDAGRLLVVVTRLCSSTQPTFRKLQDPSTEQDLIFLEWTIARRCHDLNRRLNNELPGVDLFEYQVFDTVSATLKLNNVFLDGSIPYQLCSRENMQRLAANDTPLETFMHELALATQNHTLYVEDHGFVSKVLRVVAGGVSLQAAAWELLTSEVVSFLCFRMQGPSSVLTGEVADKPTDVKSIIAAIERESFARGIGKATSLDDRDPDETETAAFRSAMHRNLPGCIEDGLIWLAGLRRGCLHRACDVKQLLSSASKPDAYAKLLQYLHKDQCSEDPITDSIGNPECQIIQIPCDSAGDMIISGRSILEWLLHDRSQDSVLPNFKALSRLAAEGVLEPAVKYGIVHDPFTTPLFNEEHCFHQLFDTGPWQAYDSDTREAFTSKTTDIMEFLPASQSSLRLTMKTLFKKIDSKVDPNQAAYETCADRLVSCLWTWRLTFSHRMSSAVRLRVLRLFKLVLDLRPPNFPLHQDKLGLQWLALGYMIFAVYPEEYMATFNHTTCEILAYAKTLNIAPQKQRWRMSAKVPEWLLRRIEHATYEFARNTASRFTGDEVVSAAWDSLWERGIGRGIALMTAMPDLQRASHVSAILHIRREQRIKTDSTSLALEVIAGYSVASKRQPEPQWLQYLPWVELKYQSVVGNPIRRTVKDWVTVLLHGTSHLDAYHYSMAYHLSRLLESHEPDPTKHYNTNEMLSAMEIGLTEATVDCRMLQDYDRLRDLSDTVSAVEVELEYDEFILSQLRHSADRYKYRHLSREGQVGRAEEPTLPLFSFAPWKDEDKETGPAVEGAAADFDYIVAMEEMYQVGLLDWSDHSPMYANSLSEVVDDDSEEARSAIRRLMDGLHALHLATADFNGAGR